VIPPARCAATSHTTGKPCRAWARPGTTVCKWHRGNDRPKSRKANVRLALSELLADGRDPRVILLDATQAADALYREGRQRLALGETLTVDELDRFLQNLNRVHAMSKIAIDARLVDQLTSAVTFDQLAALAPAETLDQIGEMGSRAVGHVLGGLIAAVPITDRDSVMYRDALRKWALSAVDEYLAAVSSGSEPPGPPPPPVPVPRAVPVPDRGAAGYGGAGAPVSDDDVVDAEVVDDPEEIARLEAELAELRRVVHVR
jgi:hypothetical protein